MLPITRRLPASAEQVWGAMTDIGQWPKWGPSLRAARLDHGGQQLRRESTGQVQTIVGVWLPFRVTQWEQGHSWAWSVAHVPATAHRVTALDATISAATIDVPLWAAPYGALCWVSLGRLGQVAAGAGRDMQP